MTLPRHTRREFLSGGMLGAAGLMLKTPSGLAAGQVPVLQAGQGVADTTPPLRIEMAGFHRVPGNERRITGIRQPTAARALVVQFGGTQAAVVSLDICGVPHRMTSRVQARVAQQTGIPAGNVRICATHSHSMPTLRYFRQWGAVSPGYMTMVEDRIVRAVGLAQADLAPAELFVGKSCAEGANFNRTSKTWKTDREFSGDSTDAERWLDTQVRVMHWRRPGAKRDLLWYHFSAHPVCYTDDNAGPDWPGLVEKHLGEAALSSPSLLQGHIGDVNPGSGEPWLGIAEDTAGRVAAAIRRALGAAGRVPVDRLQIESRWAQLPLDMERLGRWLQLYRADPSQCDRGPWVDARFARDWYRSASQWDFSKTHWPAPMTAMALGPFALLFHPAELYSFYGLAIGRDAPQSEVMVVGYTDAFVGYLPDPNAYAQEEYAAIVVPKITDLPPFVPTAARQFTRQAVDLLKAVST